MINQRCVWSCKQW